MRYDYRCPECMITVEVMKPAAESSNMEVCQCGHGMIRLFSAPLLNFPATINDSTIGTFSGDPDKALKRYNEQHGTNLAPYEPAKKKDPSYSFSDSETREIYSKLDAAGVRE